MAGRQVEKRGEEREGRISESWTEIASDTWLILREEEDRKIGRKNEEEDVFSAINPGIKLV